jgi:hypothetical protein
VNISGDIWECQFGSNVVPARIALGGEDLLIYTLFMTNNSLRYRGKDYL